MDQLHCSTCLYFVKALSASSAAQHHVLRMGLPLASRGHGLPSTVSCRWQEQGVKWAAWMHHALYGQ